MFISLKLLLNWYKLIAELQSWKSHNLSQLLQISLSENIRTDLMLSLGQAFPQFLLSHHWNVTTLKGDVLWR